jgi:hypothetical protein
MSSPGDFDSRWYDAARAAKLEPLGYCVVQQASALPVQLQSTETIQFSCASPYLNFCHYLRSQIKLKPTLLAQEAGKQWKLLTAQQKSRFQASSTPVQLSKFSY